MEEGELFEFIGPDLIVGVLSLVILSQLRSFYLDLMYLFCMSMFPLHFNIQLFTKLNNFINRKSISNSFLSTETL